MKKFRKGTALLVLAIFVAEMFLSSMTAYAFGMPKSSNAVTEASVTDNHSVEIVNPFASLLNAGKRVKSTPQVTGSGDGKKPIDLVPYNNGQAKNKLEVINNVKNENRIIVKYKDMSKAEDSKKKFSSKRPSDKLKSKRKSKRFKMESLEITGSDDVTSIINELKKDSNVEYAQPDYILDSFLTPQDNRYGEQWGLTNTAQTISGQAGIPGVDINAADAWDITAGTNNVTVAIVDTGVDTSHPELAGSVYVNTKEQPNGIDDDGNGYVDDISGWDFANNDNSTFDSETQDAHGTHVGGIINAKMNNGGITGVTPNVRILPLKFIIGDTGYTSDAIEAIQYAVDAGADIISCSWGGGEYNQALMDVMASSDALFICAAGNSGRNVDVNPVYPACFSLPNVISVASIDNKGQFAAFSNYGSKVHIAAPGVNILSTLPGNKYGFMSGTSMAAPFVSGVAALIKSNDPSLTVQDMKSRILNNATKVSSLEGKVSSSGRLNAHAVLLNNAPSATPEPTALPGPTPSPESKSKEPEPVYDTSASGNNKVPKPVMSEINLFVDSAIKTGIAKMSSDNGIENLSMFRMKEKFITVIWTTSVEANTELHYGNSEGVEKVYRSNRMTTKHQAEIMVESMDDVRFFMAKSVAQDGTELKTDVKASADYLTDLGGNAPVFPDTVLSSNETSMSDVSTMSYMADNGANYSFDTAQQINQGTVFGTAEKSVGSDYYKILLEEGKTYSIDLIGMAQGEDYDIYLYNSSQSDALDYSTFGSNYDEHIQYTPTVSGTYYLQVNPYDSTTANHNYQLVVYSQDCPPDSYEPNDGYLAATPITAGNTTEATINVNSDEDWFVLDTAKTGKLNVTLKNIPSDCDYDLEVYKDDFITPIEGSYSYNDEKITRIINEPGKYYIRVYSYTGSNASERYMLQANVYTQDAYELNDDAYEVKYQGAPAIDLGSCISATIDNPDDTDFYMFTVGSDTNVGVRLQNIPEGTDYDLAVYSFDSSTYGFTLLSSSTYGSNSDEAVISQLAEGFYYIKVYSYSGSSETQSYKLSVTDDSKG